MRGRQGGAQFRFQRLQGFLGLSAFALALVGDLQALFDRGDEVFVSALDRLNIEYAALDFFTHFFVRCAQVLGVLLE